MQVSVENNNNEITRVHIETTKRPQLFNCLIIRSNGCCQKMHRLRADWFRQPDVWNHIVSEADKLLVAPN
jgi:hypothetical protein